MGGAQFFTISAYAMGDYPDMVELAYAMTSLLSDITITLKVYKRHYYV